MVNPIQDYLRAIEKELAAGNTTEHSHRPALKILLQSLNNVITATNEPQHITVVGAPDFRIRKNNLTTGYLETKDIGKNLDEELKTDQLKRYLSSFHNFVLTDYLEFRWFVDGKLRLKEIIGTCDKNEKIKLYDKGTEHIEELLVNFLNAEPEPINTPKELAHHLARLAHHIKYIIVNSLKAELATGTLHAQMIAFRENLIPDLSIEQFADIYAQTIAYGLFAARCETDIAQEFSREKAGYLIPKTNPFLRKLFNHIAGPDLDEHIVGAVDDLAQILAQADMSAVMKGFGKSTGKEDPVVHFYETFLKEYDPKTREMRGVYYTPLPVVSYIVRSINYILKTVFDKPQGLADHRVLILDPAVGTATFLYMVMQEIHDAVIQLGQTGTWNDYVKDKLLPRLFGFELLMAPYAIAHLKLGQLLKETNYDFPTDQRLGIYLTNTLDKGIKHAETMFAQWITEEANSAAEIKNTKPIMVVLGNPPYSGHSANKGKWAKELVEVYKKDYPELKKPAQAKWLQNDYVKFLAFGQWRMDLTKYGILGFITDNSYLDNPTFRGMRKSLLRSFSDIYVLNLHGNSNKKETTPEGGKDENVFDIRQGVAIGVYVKEAGNVGLATVHYADLWGIREDKYHTLSESDLSLTTWKDHVPREPFYFFKPIDSPLAEEYSEFWQLSDVMNQNGDPAPGIVTTQDDFAISFSKEASEEKVHLFLATKSEDEARKLFRLCSQSQWNYDKAKKELDKGTWTDRVKQILYRPFDIRWTIYDSSVAVHRRERVMRHMAQNNVSFVCPRRVETSGSWHHILCASSIVDHVAVSLKTVDSVFPLYLYPPEKKEQLDKSGGKEGGTIEPLGIQENREPNLNPEFIKVFSEKLVLEFINDGNGDLKTTFGPEDIFNYTYAIFHSSTYRERYAEFLKIDFPRLPLTSNKDLFRSLVNKGAALVALHLMESPLLNVFITKYPIVGDHQIEKVRYDEKTQRVNINKSEYFEGVPPEIWNFHIGGYQVCEKWLKDRKGRKLTIDEINHYQKIVVALKETVRLMSEIDNLIPEWPIV